MKIKPFIASVIISIALVLFLRFGVSAYMLQFAFRMQEGSAWLCGFAAWLTIKSIQMSPMAYRLRWIQGIRYEWLAFIAIVTTPIDMVVMLRVYPPIDPLNLILLVGGVAWAGLVRLLVIQWIKPQKVVQPQAVKLPEPEYRSVLPIPEPVVRESRTSKGDTQFVSQLIPKVASLFIAGLSGSGKDFVGSILCEYLQSRFGAKIFFLDPKNDPDEHLWDRADYQYRFTGVPMEPEPYLDHLKRGIKQYYQRLEENGSGQYTILVINELATSATKVDNSSDKKWLSATLQPMLSGLDSAGGAVIVLTQTLIMPTGFNSGTISQFQKLIICRDEHIENLSTQSKTVLMTGVDLSGARSACEDSPIDRAIYSSALRRWLSLPRMRQGQSYYDRDTRRWVGTPPESGSSVRDSGDLRWRVDGEKNSENEGDLGDMPQLNAPQHSQHNVYNSVAPATAAVALTIDTLDDLILDYFAAVKLPQPKSLRDIKYSSRIRSTDSSDLAIQSALDRLVQSEALATDRGLWGFPEWFDLN